MLTLEAVTKIKTELEAAFKPLYCRAQVYDSGEKLRFKVFDRDYDVACEMADDAHQRLRSILRVEGQWPVGQAIPPFEPSRHPSVLVGYSPGQNGCRPRARINGVDEFIGAGGGKGVAHMEDPEADRR